MSPIKAPQTSADVELLKSELHQARALNAHLKEQLLASQLQSIRMEGALYKYRTYPVGLLNSPWVTGYFTLCGSRLKYFSSEKDVAMEPRAVLEIIGSVIEWEGLKQGHYWTFGLVDSAGCYLIRLSSNTRAVAEKWVEALEGAGAGSGRDEGGLARTMSAPQHGMSDRVQQGKSSNMFETATPGDGLAERPGATKRKGRKREVVAADVSGSPEKTAPKRSTSRMFSPMVGSTPLHKDCTSSILSSERISLVPQPGLVNLGGVVLFATNFRLLVENLITYGVLINPFKWFQDFLLGSYQPLMLCWPTLALCSLAALLLEGAAAKKATKLGKRSEAIEKGSSNKKRPPKENLETSLNVRSKVKAAKQLQMTTAIGHAVICIICLAAPLFFVRMSEDAIGPSFAATLLTLVIWMKLVSFAHCNHDLREARLMQEVRPGERESTTPIDGADQPLQYPENVTPGNMVYFLCAPTLTYQLTYPRNGRIRFKWLGRRCLEFLLMLALLVAIIDQYILPAVKNSMESVKHKRTGKYIERVLKLSIPVVYAWLCMFYILFHIWLNILAEVLRFGDRDFYKDWWNASNLGDYWRLWNMPVHKWMLRTVYYPAVNYGAGRNIAMLIVFFVSAVLHEIAVSLPLKLVNIFPWSFAGILAQVPMIVVSQHIQKKFGNRYGNIFFWVMFCVVGQPICIISYYYDWIQRISN